MAQMSVLKKFQSKLWPYRTLPCETVFDTFAASSKRGGVCIPRQVLFIRTHMIFPYRKHLFGLINDLPTVFEVVTERKTVKDKPNADSGSKSRGSTKVRAEKDQN